VGRLSEKKEKWHGEGESMIRDEKEKDLDAIGER
jgi:hypothetical protein